ncbi:hypothetical protein P691DRAFT_657515 [Macrolepiota fuliginosa MF-IS2]|uniref:Uncharacterized protein n=1 Tax=Macrolepiota fuliginosa MF-IS2 TaxID=1400762 RepID=A0A9P6C6M2_9AGAR|nr:hypothetical protein P691DRAFT_657515 [Macrolepiota fuliginosa MF-IS2]
MGSLCSKSSNYQGGHTVLGTSNTTNGTTPTSAPDPRTAAAEAAERRMQAAHQRGTNSSNPNAGRLAAQVSQQNTKSYAEPQQPERLVVCLLLQYLSSLPGS